MPFFERSSLSQRWACLCLAPILVVQGVWVRQRAPKLPEAEGRRSGGGGLGRPLRLLIVGDSSAAGVGAPHQDQALSGGLYALLKGHFRLYWKLIAQTGWPTSALRRALQAAPREAYDVALTATGLNDITSGRSLPVCLQEQVALVELLRRRFTVAHILLSGLPPVHRFPALPEPLRRCIGARARQLDRAIHAWSKGQADCDHVALNFPLGPESMACDGFHPGPGVYAMWAAAATARIMARWS